MRSTWAIICLITAFGCAEERDRADASIGRMDTAEAPLQSEDADEARSAEAADPDRLSPAQAAARHRWLEGAFLPSRSTVESIKATVGQPDSLLLSTLPPFYSTRGEVDDQVQVHVEDGIVTRIAFSYYSG